MRDNNPGKCIRDYGLVPGFMPAGLRNSITDVPGVRVGHCTLKDETHNTGVTVILPRENIFENKLAAAASVINGYGKSTGLIQIAELGQLESPIALTGTLNVGKVMEGLVDYMTKEREKKGKRLRSFNAVVGECNDSGLNLPGARPVEKEHLLAAIAAAKEDFEQGCVGAGTGMTCHGLKGGIGSASRIINAGGSREWTLGVLSLCNHGELRELTVLGRRIGPQIMEAMKKKSPGEDKGSCIVVLATDAPLSSRQLTRVARRCAAGLARCGSYWGHGSGDIVIAFSTAQTIKEDESEFVVPFMMWNEDRLDILFQAAAEAAEESVLNALCAARTATGPEGNIRRALCEFADILAADRA